MSQTIQEKLDRPVRVGVFTDISATREAVDALLDAGIPQSKISVVCSDETKERYFKEFEHQQPAGSTTPMKATAGSALGALLAGGTAIVAAGATGGVALLAAGGVSAWAGGVLGGLVGAMMSRGVEKEIANYYNQAVLEGKLLIAVEADENGPSGHLLTAEKIFARFGAEPLALPEG
jgi:hypothetical protein